VALTDLFNFGFNEGTWEKFRQKVLKVTKNKKKRNEVSKCETSQTVFKVTLRRFKQPFQFTAVLAPIRSRAVVIVGHSNEDCENCGAKRKLGQNRIETVPFSPQSLLLFVSVSLPRQ
jgi:hypothetical protein